MKTTIFKIASFVAIIAAVFAEKGDENLAKMFARERREMRADFRREISRLTEEDKKQQVEVNKLHDKVDQQNQENADQKKEILRLHKKLRKADLENKRANRQRDEKESQVLEAKIQSAIRRDRQSSELKDAVVSVMRNAYNESGSNETSITSELKKLIHAEINNFLMVTKLCVSGRVDIGKDDTNVRRTVNFGYTFPRKPTFLVSLVRFYSNGDSTWVGEGVSVKSVSNSKAVVSTGAYKTTFGTASWIACL